MYNEIHVNSASVVSGKKAVPHIGACKLKQKTKTKNKGNRSLYLLHIRNIVTVRGQNLFIFNLEMASINIQLKLCICTELNTKELQRDQKLYMSSFEELMLFNHRARYFHKVKKKMQHG